MRLFCALALLSTLAPASTIQRVAGAGSPVNLPPSEVNLGPVGGLAVTGAGDLYLGLPLYRVVVRLDAGANAFDKQLSGTAWGLALDPAGRLYAGFTEMVPVGVGLEEPQAVLLRVNPDGTTVTTPLASPGAGSGHSLAADALGNVYFGWSDGLRKLTPEGTLNTIPGTGTPAGIALDAAGNIYVADQSTHRVLQVTAGGAVTPIAGTGAAGYSGDNGPASAAQLNKPDGIAVDAAGNLYVSDLGNHRVRKISTTGIITTFAGRNSPGCPIGWPFRAAPAARVPRKSPCWPAPTGCFPATRTSLSGASRFPFFRRPPKFARTTAPALSACCLI